MGVSLAVLLMAGVWAGCSDELSKTASDGSETTRAMLAGEMETFGVVDSMSSADLTARLNAYTHWEEGDVRLGVASGSVAVSVAEDSNLVLHELFIRFAPFHVSPEVLPPQGLHFAAVHLLLEEEIWFPGTLWLNDDDVAMARSKASLTLDWALVTEAAVVPLAPQRIHGLEVDLVLYPLGEVLAVDLVIREPATFWNLGDLAELSALRLVVHGEAGDPGPPVVP